MDAKPRDMPTPFPDHRDLYLLVAGVLLGVLLSPAVLGQLSPRTYDAWFVGGGEEAAMVAAEERAIGADLDRLRAIGVTPVAIQEELSRRLNTLAPLKMTVEQAQAERAAALQGWMTGAVLCVLIVMAIEAVTAPNVEEGQPASVSPTTGRLKSVRYALLAVWVALAVARPAALADLPWLFIALLLLVALAAGLVPLGRSA